VRRVSTRTLVALGVLVALVLSGVVSFYASSNPDGLERVAQDHGFADTAHRHATSEGPLADYRTKGVADDRLSGGLAGVAGALVVLVLAGGLVLLVRRRPSSDSGNGPSSGSGTMAGPSSGSGTGAGPSSGSGTGMRSGSSAGAGSSAGPSSGSGTGPERTS
jgi:hypothetical protein